MKTLRNLWLLLPLFALWSCLADMPVDNKTDEEKKKDLKEAWKNEIDPDGDGIGINPAYVPIDWDEKEAVVTDHDAVKGDFTLDFGENEVPELEKGSILTLDVDTAIYLRKVTSVTKENGKVVLKTEQARMDEVFFDTDFELRVGDVSMIDTTKTEDEWEHEYTTRAGKEIKPSRAIYPTEVILTDDNGNHYRLPYDMTRAELDFSKTWGFSGNLINKDYLKLTVDGSLTLGLSLAIYMNFSTDDEWLELYDKYDNNQLYFKFTLKPYVGVDLNATLAVSGDLIDEESAPKTMISFTAAAFKFIVGGVPILVDVDVEADFKGKTKTNLQGAITTGVHLTGEFQIGFEVSQADGFKPFCKPDFQSNFNPPTFSLSTNTNLKVYASPKVILKLYKVIGPNVKFSPYVDMNFGAGVVADLTDAFQSDENGLGLGWNMDAGFGLEANMGVTGEAKLPVIGKTKFFDEESDTITFVERKTIFQAPYDLKTVSNTEYVDIKKWNKITFDVRSKLLKLKIPTIIPVCVRFDTTGDGWISDESKKEGQRGFCLFSDTKGRVSIWWYPTKSSDVLTAKVYTPDGKILDASDVTISTAPDDVQAIDLGGDILWASKNFGADKPEDPGGLYGWGDAAGTHKQQCFDKSYGSYVKDPKKCYDYYGGYDRMRNITGGSKDIAHKEWGGAWYIPTIDDWMWLYYNCDFSWTGSGVMVTSRENGNKMFLPAAGSRWGDKKQDAGVTGEYWTSTYKANGEGDEETDRCAYYVFFKKDHPSLDWHYTYRFVGQSIRPVRNKN